jgi:hypothetical protein
MWFNFNDSAFNDYWNNEDSSAVLDPATINVDTFDACHYVIIVGYHDTGDPDTSYWVVLNSWGAPANRPDGTFRLKMYMNYNLQDDTGGTTYAFDFINSADFSSVHPPQVTGVSPDAGATTGGNTVTITGIGFTGATKVLFGAIPSPSFTVSSDTTIKAKVPPAVEGFVDVTVDAGKNGVSPTTTKDQYTYETQPVVSDVSPLGGLAGTSVTISGSGFTGATGVKFGGIPATSFSVGGDDGITAVTPPQNTGCVDVTVTAPLGTSSTSAAGMHSFCYVTIPVISGVSPDNGPLSGGNTITITGAGFKGPGIYSLSFGPVNSQSPYTNTVDVVDDNTIIVTVPAAKTAGTVDVQLFTDVGTSPVSPGDQYTYDAIPVVSGISPDTGSASGGTAVTITGTNLDDATSVKFGNTPATGITVLPRCWKKGGGVICDPWGPEQIQVTSPAGSAGSADVTVTTPGGTSRVVPADEFTYNANPAIFSVTPNSGPAGTLVTITGEGFDSTSTVSFGGTASTNVTYTPRCVANICMGGITVTVPAEPVLTQYLSGGQVDITVTTAGRGTSEISPQDLYSYATVPAPVITGISPGTGLPGTTVNITGTNLGGATEVDFGGKPATNLAVIPVCNIAALGTCLMGRNSDQDSLQVTVPTAPYTIASSSALGQTVDVLVTTRFGGTSATSPSDHFTYFEIPVETSTHRITGSIAVTSDPAGGYIFIDGTITGQKTPYTFTKITPGDYKVAVRLEKFTPQIQSVTVNPFETATADFAFLSNLTPSLASYLAEQRLSHITPIIPLPTPSPTVTEPFTGHPVNLNPVYITPSVTTNPATTLSIPHEATTLHIEQPGSLSVTSTPSGAAVWVNGYDTGQTSPAVLSEDAGSYQVLVKLDCYGVPDTQTVTVNSGQETTADFSLTRLDTCPINPVSVITHVRYPV